VQGSWEYIRSWTLDVRIELREKKAISSNGEQEPAKVSLKDILVREEWQLEYS
jgi:hypothetical protein